MECRTRECECRGVELGRVVSMACLRGHQVSAAQHVSRRSV